MEDITPAIRELQRAEDIIRRELEHRLTTSVRMTGLDKLPAPAPVVTIQGRGKKRVHGWYKPGAWKSDTTDAANLLAGDPIRPMDEICIAAEGLNRNTDAITVTLIHEVIHHIAHQMGNKDVNDNGYHNVTFERLANYTGFDAERSGSRGYYDLQPRRDGKTLIDQVALDKDAFDLFRKDELDSDTEATGMLNKQKKWECDCTKIRSGRYVDATCNVCGRDFAYADKDVDEPKRQAWLARMKNRRQLEKDRRGQ